MINLQIDKEEMKEVFLQKVEEYLQEVETDVFFMNSKQLATYLNLSWSTITETILYHEEFPRLRAGSKWLFYTKEVKAFMEKYYEEVRNNGGDILKYKRKVWIIQWKAKWIT